MHEKLNFITVPNFLAELVGELESSQIQVRALDVRLKLNDAISKERRRALQRLLGAIDRRSESFTHGQVVVSRKSYALQEQSPLGGSFEHYADFVDPGDERIIVRTGVRPAMLNALAHLAGDLELANLLEEYPDPWEALGRDLDAPSGQLRQTFYRRASGIAPEILARRLASQGREASDVHAQWTSLGDRFPTVFEYAETLNEHKEGLALSLAAGLSNRLHTRGLAEVHASCKAGALKATPIALVNQATVAYKVAREDVDQLCELVDRATMASEGVTAQLFAVR